MPNVSGSVRSEMELARSKHALAIALRTECTMTSGKRGNGATNSLSLDLTKANKLNAKIENKGQYAITHHHEP